MFLRLRELVFLQARALSHLRAPMLSLAQQPLLLPATLHPPLPPLVLLKVFLLLHLANLVRVTLSRQVTRPLLPKYLTLVLRVPQLPMSLLIVRNLLLRKVLPHYLLARPLALMQLQAHRLPSSPIVMLQEHLLALLTVRLCRTGVWELLWLLSLFFSFDTFRTYSSLVDNLIHPKYCAYLSL